MDDEHEAKFVALKNLQTKKLKSLMSSIDAKDKEIAKLKILGKDNRRAQMIQELRKKIRTHETINDILKEELQKRTETTIEDANNLIIRKTLAGPKRFRPLSREELENKIIELEKVVNKKQREPATSSNIAPSAANNRLASTDAKAEISAQPKTVTASSEAVSASKVDDVGRFVSLVDEVDDLCRTVRSKDAVIDAQKEEIIRLRSRNAQLIVVEEEAEYQEKQYHELKVYNDSLLGNLEDTTRKLAEALDATMKLRAEALLDNESRIAEIDALHAQNEKYMRQHAQLLSTIAELEVERESHTTHVHQSRQHASSTAQSLQEKDATIRAWEEKYARLEEKLRACEKKVILLSKENAQIDELKEQLREKNIALKELKRNLDEKMKLKSMQSVGPAAVSAGALGLGASVSGAGLPGVASDAQAEAKADGGSPNRADRKGEK